MMARGLDYLQKTFYRQLPATSTEPFASFLDYWISLLPFSSARFHSLGTPKIKWIGNDSNIYFALHFCSATHCHAYSFSCSLITSSRLFFVEPFHASHPYGQIEVLGAKIIISFSRFKWAFEIKWWNITRLQIIKCFKVWILWQTSN